MKRFYIPLFFALFLYSCANHESDTSSEPREEKETKITPSKEEKITDIFPEKEKVTETHQTEKGGVTEPTFKLDNAKMLKLVNAYRKEGCKCGDKFFRPVPPLVWNDALERAALNHSEDMKVNDFFSHTGSDGSNIGDRIKEVGYTWRACGENIALGQKNEEAVMQIWIESTGHCENIMDPNYKEMGAASINRYWTQVFATSF